MHGLVKYVFLCLRNDPDQTGRKPLFDNASHSSELTSLRDRSTPSCGFFEGRGRFDAEPRVVRKLLGYNPSPETDHKNPAAWCFSSPFNHHIVGFMLVTFHQISHQISHARLVGS